MLDFIFNILNLLLGGLLEKRRKSKAIKLEFDVLRNRVLHAGITNNIPVELHKLRNFLLENDLINRPGLDDFFAKWLTNPVVISGIPALGLYSDSSIRQLHTQLTEIIL